MLKSLGVRLPLALGMGVIAAQLAAQGTPPDSARPTPVLKTVTVSGRAVTYPSFFAGPYKRAAAGRGFFFTREDIQQWNSKDFESILNRIPGVSANERGVTFQRCQSGLEVTSNPKLNAKVQVWIDGNRVAIGRDEGRGRDEAEGLYTLLSSIKPHMIQIMEVYPSVATIPAEFLSDACAVIVIWTKRD